jgi:ADP-ribose 1''-phosphate phosphatase
MAMAIKRVTTSDENRPLKQTKLHFGRKMATKSDASSSKRDSRDDESTKPEKASANEVPEKVASSSTTPSTSNPTTSANADTFTVTEITGDIFDAPDNTVIIHACNCAGSWGAGIALAFKQRYPKAFQVYKSHCLSETPASLVGTALLIPPMETQGPRHYVGCLFTSKKFGRGRDTPAQILKNTGPAMESLVIAMAEVGGVEEIRMCQINSGLFSVPWDKSRAVIEDLNIGEIGGISKEIKVFSPA